jgi:hypothetical protein
MRCVLGFLFLTGVVASANANLLSYRFDSDAEGWRRGDFNSSTFVLTDLGGATWNSGGYIDADDFSSWAFHLSPILNQDFSAATKIEFDYSSVASDNAYPFLVIASSTAAIYQVAAVPADGLFHHYSYDFVPGTWQYSDGVNFRAATAVDLSSVLASVKQFGVNADQVGGADYTRLDNVAVVPEPASLLVLGLGLLGIRKRRR